MKTYFICMFVMHSVEKHVIILFHCPNIIQGAFIFKVFDQYINIFKNFKLRCSINDIY